MRRYLSIYIFINLFIYLSIHKPFIYNLFIYSSIYLFIYLSIHQYIYLFIYICLFIYLFIYSSNYLSYLSIKLIIFYLSFTKFHKSARYRMWSKYSYWWLHKAWNILFVVKILEEDIYLFLYSSIYLSIYLFINPLSTYLSI